MDDRSDIPSILETATGSPFPSRVAQVLMGTELTARSVAQAVGVPSRFALAHRMRDARAITFVELRQWIAVDQLLRATESGGPAPCEMLLGAGKDPAAFYHVVRELTGRPWSEVKELGSAWLMGRLAERCHERLVELKRAMGA